MVKILKFLFSVKGSLVTLTIISDQTGIDEKEVSRILRLLRGMNYVAKTKDELWTITQDGIDRLARD